MNLQENYLQLLKEQVKPALGCTEPVAIALACAKAMAILEGEIKSIKIETSKGLFKNAHGVGIPKTAETGILIAAALGALAGKPEAGLEVLQNVNSVDVKNAKEMLEQGQVSASFVDSPEGVYVKALVERTGGSAIVCIEGQHNHISYIEKNGQTIYSEKSSVLNSENSFSMQGFSVADIIATVENLDSKLLGFLLEGVEMNKRIALEGINYPIGLKVGYGIALLQDKGVLGSDLVDKVKMLVAAASDARMGGSDLPVMTSSGSGNQGIVAILPVAMLAEKLGKSKENLAKALAISHLINAYVKEHLGRLSPICGCSVSAGLGATAAIAWLLGGNIKQIAGAMQSVAANLTGILCDGAKGSCSFKLATSAGEAIISAYLALEDIYIHKVQGIVGETIEDTIRNFSLISKKGMEKTDEAILEIMLKTVG